MCVTLNFVMHILIKCGKTHTNQIKVVQSKLWSEICMIRRSLNMYPDLMIKGIQTIDLNK